jgi:hypothetical protein
MTTTATRTGYRYIEADWGDNDRPGRWHLWVDGRHTATAPLSGSYPPFALTEGLPFVAQYHSATAAMCGEPDSWVYHPQPRATAFWPLMAAAAVLLAASVAWRPALVVAFAVMAAALAVEVRGWSR